MRSALGTQYFKLLISYTAFIAVLFSLSALAEPTTKRHKVIDFDDEVVEGLNKRPLDSLNHISDAERRRRQTHLYRKRTGFGTEITETLQTLRFTP